MMLNKNNSRRANIPWKDINFKRIKIKVNNKDQFAAECLFCNNLLRNIGYKRLLGHRNVCKGHNTGDDNSKNIAGNNMGILESRPESTFTSRLTNKESQTYTQMQIDNSESEPELELEPLPTIASQEKGEPNMNYQTEKNQQQICALKPPNFGSKESLSEFDEALGMFFFSCGIPFSVVESEYFLKFVCKLNLKYHPPTRRTLSGSILDKIHERVTKKDYFSENHKSVLIIDGWKNSVKNEKLVVVTIHNADDKRLFLDAWDFTDKSETAESLKEVVEEATKIAKKIYNTDIYAVVSDNVSSMICMGNKIDQWHVTCNSHSGNLLAKDLVDSVFTAKVIKVLKSFKSSSLERRIVILGGCRIVLPGDTIWCNYRDSYRCYLRNLSFMRQIIMEGEFNHILTAEVIGLVSDEDFEQNVLSFVILFDGTCELTNKCQQSNFNIADSLEEWLKLQFPFYKEEYEFALESRLKKVVKPIALASNILHPLYKGKLFDDNEKYKEMALSFFKENLDADGLKDLSAYEEKTGIFFSLDKKGVTCPETFWTFAAPRHPKLSEFARKLLRIPSSTAAIERLFSQWSFIHSKLRNRLETEKSKKLIQIYYIWKMSFEEEY